MSAEEILYWSHTDRYNALDYSLAKKATCLNLNLSGPLMFASRDRIFCRVANEIRILDRIDRARLVGSIKLEDSATCCVRVDEESRVYVKTSKGELAKRIYCYDRDGIFLGFNEHTEMQAYVCFELLDKNSLSFTDFKQENIILF